MTTQNQLLRDLLGRYVQQDQATGMTENNLFRSAQEALTQPADGGAVSLSSRLRPNVACAPWVIDEVRKLEALTPPASKPAEGGEVVEIGQARFDAGCDVLAYLRQEGAPPHITSRMLACLHGDPERTTPPASQEQAQQPSDFDNWFSDRYPNRHDRQSEFRMTSVRDLMREAWNIAFGSGCVHGAEVATKPQPMTDWQPIETAPKDDGQCCWVVVNGDVCRAFYVRIKGEEFRDTDGSYIDQIDADEYWMDAETGDSIEPTMYQPLVAPPPPDHNGITSDK